MMATIAFWGCCILSATSTGCASSGMSPAKTAETDAINAAETAWILSATACTAFADAAVKAKCSAALIPARAALIAAAEDVDQGGANYGCELRQLSTALAYVATLGVTLPAGVRTAQTLLSSVTCTPPVTDAATTIVLGTQDAAIALAFPSLVEGGSQ
jgi:hypothetical protein